MTYIILTAGKGSRLYPLTMKYPKTLYKLDKKTSVFGRMVNLIKKYDKKAEIVAVVGFMAEEVKKEIPSILYVENPFYEVTNSIASLWFARNYLERSQVTIINGDVVLDDMLVERQLCREVGKPTVFIDSSIKEAGDYNVQVSGDRVLVMSKELEEYYGEYAGVTKLNQEFALELKKNIEKMVREGIYDQWYENVLVQMIFNEDFELHFQDICDYKWTEVDCVGDMLLAKKIHMETIEKGQRK